MAKCLFQPKDQRTQIMLGDKNEFGFQCSHELKQLNNISQEIFSRIFKPLYIPFEKPPFLEKKQKQLIIDKSTSNDVRKILKLEVVLNKRVR